MSHFVEGIIRGKTIELQADPGFAEGQRVSMPSTPQPPRTPMWRRSSALRE